MDAGLLSEVKTAVELSLRGDPDSVTRSTALLSDSLPLRKGFLPSLLAVTVDNSVKYRHSDRIGN